MIHLFEYHNPQVAQYTEKTVFDSSEKLDLNKINFKLAFTVEKYLDPEQRNDHRYVKYLVRVWGKEKGIEKETVLKHHPCTEEDWASFPPT